MSQDQNDSNGREPRASNPAGPTSSNPPLVEGASPPIGKRTSKPPVVFGPPTPLPPLPPKVNSAEQGRSQPPGAPRTSKPPTAATRTPASAAANAEHERSGSHEPSESHERSESHAPRALSNIFEATPALGTQSPLVAPAQQSISLALAALEEERVLDANPGHATPNLGPPPNEAPSPPGQAADVNSKQPVTYVLPDPAAAQSVVSAVRAAEANPAPPLAPATEFVPAPDTHAAPPAVVPTPSPFGPTPAWSGVTPTPNPPYFGPSLAIFAALFWAYLVMGELVVSRDFPERFATLIVLGVFAWHCRGFAERLPQEVNWTRKFLPAALAPIWFVFVLLASSAVLGTDSRSATEAVTVLLWFVAVAAFFIGRRLTRRKLPPTVAAKPSMPQRLSTGALWLLSIGTTLFALISAADRM